MADEVNAEILSGDPRDPTFMKQCIERLVREINILKNIAVVNMEIGTQVLAAFSAAGGDTKIGQTSPSLAYVRNRIREIEALYGEHPLLQQFDEFCGRKPLHLVE
jgi:hypothetical protein